MKKFHAIDGAETLVNSVFTIQYTVLHCVVYFLKVCTESVIDLFGGLVDALPTEILEQTERVRSFSRKCKSLDESVKIFE